MAAEQYDVHGEVLRVLLSKVQADPYPSGTMMDMIEQMLEPDQVPAYAEILMEKIRRDRFPSLEMLQRVAKLA
ncbi:MAG TPA: hypothetical protein VF165_11495 [Nocardioidaceae bacterium]